MCVVLRKGINIFIMEYGISMDCVVNGKPAFQVTKRYVNSIDKKKILFNRHSLGD